MPKGDPGRTGGPHPLLQGVEMGPRGAGVGQGHPRACPALTPAARRPAWPASKDLLNSVLPPPQDTFECL